MGSDALAFPGQKQTLTIRFQLFHAIGVICGLRQAIADTPRRVAPFAVVRLAPMLWRSCRQSFSENGCNRY